MADPLQVWIRNDKGKVWGPLMPATIELFFDNQLIPGKVQISLDGANYVYPARLPEVRDSVPRALWGEGEAGNAPPAAAAPAAAQRIPGGPPKLGGPPSLSPSVPGGPMAGPGAVASAQARAAAASAPVPGARVANDRRTVSADMGAAVVAKPPPPPQPVEYTAPAVELPAKGTLQTTPALRLYYLAASTDATGLLTITLQDRTVLIHFRKGNAEFVDSTHAEDQLSTFLVKNQLASFEQLGKAEKEKAGFGGELIGALFGLGLLNPSTAFQHLGQRAGTILTRGLFAEHGTFTWEAKDLPAHKAMPLGQRWAVVAEQVRKLPGADLKRRLATAINLPVMKSGGAVPVEEIRLTPQELRAVSHFDGVRSLNQLLHDLPTEADHLLRVAFLLKDFELVAFAGVHVPPPDESVATPAPAPVAPIATPIPAAPPRPPPPKITGPAAPAAAPRPPPVVTAPGAATRPGNPTQAPGGRPPVMTPTPRPAAAPPGPPRGPPVMTPSAAKPIATPVPIADFGAEVKQLTELLVKLKTQNHFEVLGLKENTDASAVKAAYFKAARIYHPDTVPPTAPEALGKLKAEIFARISEANRTLADDKLRAEYAEEVKSGNAGEKVDIAQILAAEEKFQKGSILVKARKFPEAVKMLDEAIKAADEAEYYALRGYAKFFTFPDKKLGFSEAMKDINVCLKRNANIANVHYYQGHMVKLLGDNPAAKKHFQKCLQLNPDHLDAQRELRMLK
jgi:DnaJ-domain-containing protein 1